MDEPCRPRYNWPYRYYRTYARTLHAGTSRKADRINACMPRLTCETVSRTRLCINCGGRAAAAAVLLLLLPSDNRPGYCSL